MARQEIDPPTGAGFVRREFLKLSGGVAGVLLAGAALPRLDLGPGLSAVPLPADKEAPLAPDPGVKHFYVYATDGYVRMPDGNRIYIRGFAANNPPTTPVADPSSLIGKAQLPAPIIDVVEGDQCFVHFREVGHINPIATREPHTIHLHGLHVSTQNDGVPETSFHLMGMGATYYFRAEHPGTYMWHCHYKASEHVQLGMYGALIVRPRTNTANTVYGGIMVNGEMADRFDKEYVMLLSDIDSRWHQSIESGKSDFNPVEFRPDYWLVNGRAFPDTLLPAQTVFTGNEGGPCPGYDAYVHVRHGQHFLLRMINIGYQPVPWHIHGWHFTVVGNDASPLLIQSPDGMLHKKFTVNIGSGETYDLIVEAHDKIGEYGNRSPREVPYAPVPKAGGGTHTYDGTRETFYPQFYPMHNHDDYKVTNNGQYPGGQLTLIQADAP